MQNEILFLAGDTDPDVSNGIIDAMTDNYWDIPEGKRKEVIDTLLATGDPSTLARVVDMVFVNIEAIKVENLEELLDEIVSKSSPQIRHSLLKSYSTNFSRMPGVHRDIIANTLKRILTQVSDQLSFIYVLVEMFEKATPQEHSILKDYCQNPDPKLAGEIAELVKADIPGKALEEILMWISMDVDEEVRKKADGIDIDDIEIE